MWRIDLANDEAVVMVEVLDSTPEPDGTHRTYWLRVPPSNRTAREGVAWTFGLDADGTRRCARPEPGGRPPGPAAQPTARARTSVTRARTVSRAWAGSWPRSVRSSAAQARSASGSYGVLSPSTS